MSSSLREKFSFKLDEYFSDIKQVFKSIRHEDSLSDVTLVCGDEVIKAHKVVLCSASEFFRNLFRKCEKDNPVIVLKMSDLPQLSSLLDFLYEGEVEIEQDNLQTFLSTAAELRIKGLTQNDSKQDEDPDKQQIYAPFSNSSSQLLQSHSTTGSSNFLQSSDLQAFPSYEEICKVSLGYSEPLLDAKDDVASSVGSHDYQAIGVGHASEDGDDNRAVSPVQDPSLSFRNGSWCCGKCGQSNRSKVSMREHMESHLENSHTFFCSSCGKPFKTRTSMRLHKYRSHVSEKLLQQISYVI